MDNGFNWWAVGDGEGQRLLQRKDKRKSCAKLRGLKFREHKTSSGIAGIKQEFAGRARCDGPQNEQPRRVAPTVWYPVEIKFTCKRLMHWGEGK